MGISCDGRQETELRYTNEAVLKCNSQGLGVFLVVVVVVVGFHVGFSHCAHRPWGTSGVTLHSSGLLAGPPPSLQPDLLWVLLTGVLSKGYV